MPIKRKIKGGGILGSMRKKSAERLEREIKMHNRFCEEVCLPDREGRGPWRAWGVSGGGRSDGGILNTLN